MFKKDVKILDEQAKRSRQGTRGSDLSGSRPVRKQHYIVTIKCNTICHTTKDQLDFVYARIVRTLPRAEWSDCLMYEVDKAYRTHIHTVVCITGAEPFFKKYQQKNWNIDFKPFPADHMPGVISYIRKHYEGNGGTANLFYENRYMFANSFLFSPPPYPALSLDEMREFVAGYKDTSCPHYMDLEVWNDPIKLGKYIKYIL